VARAALGRTGKPAIARDLERDKVAEGGLPSSGWDSASSGARRRGHTGDEGEAITGAAAAALLCYSNKGQKQQGQTATDHPMYIHTHIHVHVENMYMSHTYTCTYTCAYEAISIAYD